MDKNCYQCKHRGGLAGNAHSCCQHPKAADALSDSVGNILAIFVNVGRSNPAMSPTAVELGIKANAHGIAKGWFNWPWNFDPAWLENCNGFEERD